MSQNPIVFVISDSAGETGESVVKAAAIQFRPKPLEIRRISFINDESVVDEVIKSAKRCNGIIVFTLVIPRLRSYLIHHATQNGVEYIDLLGPIINSLEKVLDKEALYQPGMIHKLDEDYFKRIEAVEFAVKYDDGRDATGITKADIILVGVSRTSKTPLSMYLAHKNFKVANVPLVPELQPPEQLFSVSSKKIVGLRINEQKLNAIRTERLKTLGLGANAIYANSERIQTELEYANEIMSKLGCAVIDVSNKAVEETATHILEMFRDDTIHS
jgi:regulator of PEP synthase PpsR (kinase-PPPase family)